MLEGLTKFLNAVTNAVPKLYAFYRKGRHEQKIVELLECFYIFGDLIQTAEELLDLVRDKEEVVFSELSRDELSENYSLVQAKLTIQSQRLKRLGDFFLSNPTIELLDVDIKDELKKAIGSKEQGLFSVGAGLFFNQILGTAGREGEDKDDRFKRIVKEKYEFAGSLVNIDRVSVSEQSKIFEDLKLLRKRYRECLDSVVEGEHKTLLAAKGKELAEQYSVRQ